MGCCDINCHKLPHLPEYSTDDELSALVLKVYRYAKQLGDLVEGLSNTEINIDIDTELLSSSTNPVENRVVYKAIQDIIKKIDDAGSNDITIDNFLSDSGLNAVQGSVIYKALKDLENALTKKISSIESNLSERCKCVVDSALSFTSKNPVENQVIAAIVKDIRDKLANIENAGSNPGGGGSPSSNISSKVLTIYKKSDTVPGKPVGGAYDFTNNSFTAPSGWTTSVDYSSDDKTWCSIGHVLSGSNAIQWSDPFIVNGNVTDGLLVKSKVLSIYKASNTTPSQPTGGSYNFDTDTLTAPTGWKLSSDSFTDSDIVWLSIGTVTNEDNVISWSKPLRITPGVGSSNITTAFVAIAYKTSTEKPSTPTGGSYDFDTKVLTAPSGWQKDALSGDNAWFSARVFYKNGTITDWSEPQPAASADVTLTAANLEVIAQKIKLTSNELSIIAGNVNLDAEDLNIISRNVVLTTDNLKTIADNIDVNAIDLNILAQKINLTTQELNTIASKVTLTSDNITAIANKINLNSDQLSIIAGKVSFSSNDFGIIASKITLSAADLNTVANNVTLSSSNLLTIANNITLSTQELNTIAGKVNLTTEQLKIVAANATVTVTDNQIVSALTNSEGAASSIIQAINNGGSSVKISADKIELNGDVIVNAISAKDLKIGTGIALNGDGSGSLANGKISWSKDGNLTIGGWKITDTYIQGGNTSMYKTGEISNINGTSVYWKLGSDGSGSLGRGAISWDASGKVTLTSSNITFSGDISMGGIGDQKVTISNLCLSTSRSSYIPSATPYSAPGVFVYTGSTASNYYLPSNPSAGMIMFVKSISANLTIQGNGKTIYHKETSASSLSIGKKPCVLFYDGVEWCAIFDTW